MEVRIRVAVVGGAVGLRQRWLVGGLPRGGSGGDSGRAPAPHATPTGSVKHGGDEVCELLHGVS